MQNEYIDQIQKIGLNSYSTLQDVATINSKMLQKLSELQLNYATDTIESSMEQVKSTNSMTQYGDMFKTVAKLTEDFGHKLVEFTRQATDVVSNANGEVISVIEKGIMDPVKATTAKAPVKRAPKKEIEKSS